MTGRLPTGGSPRVLRAVLPAAALLLAAAGPVGTRADSGTGAIPGPFDQSFGWVVQQLPGVDANTQPSNSGEPGIAINRLGHVVVNTFGPTIWISHDDGRTFSWANQSIDPGCPSGDADAAVSFDDTYYADNLCLAGPTNLSYTSRDGGATWQAGGHGLPTPVAQPDADRQWYATDPVNPGVVYLAFHDLQGPNINVWRSNDYGQTFAQYSSVTLLGPTFVDSSQGNLTSRMQIDPDHPDTLSLLYAYNDAVSSITSNPVATDFNLRLLGLARSSDGGKSWTNSVVYDAGYTGGQTNTIAHDFPQATTDSAGNIYVVFSERIGGQTSTHIMLGVIRRGAATFSKVVQVDSGGLGANVFAWPAAGDPGMVDVSWYGSPSSDNNDHNARWSEMFAQTTNALSASPTFTQSRVSGQKPTHSADICLAGTLCPATGGDRNLFDFQGVAVDPCGYAQAVWDDDSTSSGSTVVGRQTAGTSIRPSAPGCARSATVTSSASPPAQAAFGSPLPVTAPEGPGRWLAIAAVALSALFLVATWRRRAAS